MFVIHENITDISFTVYRLPLAVVCNDDDFCYKRVQTPGMSPHRAGAWTYCLFTPVVCK